MTDLWHWTQSLVRMNGGENSQPPHISIMHTTYKPICLTVFECVDKPFLLSLLSIYAWWGLFCKRYLWISCDWDATVRAPCIWWTHGMTWHGCHSNQFISKCLKYTFMQTLSRQFEKEGQPFPICFLIEWKNAIVQRILPISACYGH